MIILGASSDDKGAQFESIIKATLEGQGYIEVRRNRIDSGANELDVTAELHSPMMTQTHVTPVVCEAKAYGRPMAMPDWQKFLGKLLLERLQNRNTIGVFVALNGVNGNVHGSYKALREKDHSTFIFEGYELQRIAAEKGELIPDADALSQLGSLFSRTPTSVEAAYYGGGFFWVVRWDAVEYSIAHGQGAYLSEDQLEQLRPALEASVGGRLVETSEAQARAEAAHRERVSVIGKLLTQGAVPLADLDDWLVRELDSEPFVDLDAHRVHLLPADALPAEAVARLFRSIFDRPVSVAQLSFMIRGAHEPYVRRLIDCIPDFQNGFHPGIASLEKLKTLVIYFPSAWMRLLTPIPMITTHRFTDSETDDSMDAADHMNFWESVVETIRSDFSNVFLRGLLYDHLGIAEIEERTTIVVKSKVGVVGEMTLELRNAIGQLDDDLVGEAGTRHILIRTLPRVPQPWEQLHPEPRPLDNPDNGSVS